MRGADRLTRLSLLAALTGLGLMYTASAAFEPRTARPAGIARGDIGSTVRVRGTVTDVERTDEAVFFTVSGKSGDIRAVSFSDRPDLAAGEAYAVTGRVDIYQGELELIVENVVPQGSTAPPPG
ncbi:MAG: OB-fold nucleic acid binding domain-containing protein [Candidatus Nanohaloarchaea archaeon]|nr:OB-fold nucleic acid binding domain-containing protein [Candidatus Nanohaloarchaea archaeon]